MITKVQKYINASDFRKNLSRYLKSAKKNPLVISTDRGKDTRVVLDADLYNELVEAYENQIDAECLVKLAKTDQGERISWDKMKKQHGMQD